MKFIKDILFHIMWIVSLVTFLQSCCETKENCPSLTQNEWLNHFSTKNIIFESTFSNSMTISFDTVSENQDQDPECIPAGMGPCRCKCYSFSQLSGEILKTSDSALTGPIFFKYVENSDVKDKNYGNETQLEIKFINSERNFDDPYSPRFEQIDFSVDTIGVSKRIIRHEDYTKSPFTRSSIATRNITAIFLSKNEGLVGFEIDSTEKYFKIN